MKYFVDILKRHSTNRLLFTIDNTMMDGKVRSGTFTETADYKYFDFNIQKKSATGAAKREALYVGTDQDGYVCNEDTLEFIFRGLWRTPTQGETLPDIDIDD